MKKIYFLLSVLCFTTLFTSCKDDEKENLTISPKELNLIVGDTKTITVNGGVSGCDFMSGNEYIASVENDGSVTAIRVGETEIRITDKNNLSAKCKVKVTGKSKLYTEPCLKFGSSISQVKSFEKRTLKSEDRENLYYKGENSKVHEISYSFTDNKLTGSTVLIPGTKTNAELVGEFIAERYLIVEIEDTNIYFRSVDKKAIGLVTAGYIGSMLYCLIIYAPAQTTADKSVTTDTDTHTIKEKVNKIKNSIIL